jgi:hypothetical protein
VFNKTFLGPLVFKIFIDYIYSGINHSKILLLVDNLKYFVPLSRFKIVLSYNQLLYPRKDDVSLNTNDSLYQRTQTLFSLDTKLETLKLLSIDFVKSVGLLIISQLHFHCHDDYIFIATMITFFLNPLRICGLIPNIAFSFSTLGNIYLFYIFQLLELN